MQRLVLLAYEGQCSVVARVGGSEGFVLGEIQVELNDQRPFIWISD